MISHISASILAAGWFSKTVNYQLVENNSILRFLLVLIILILTLAAGRMLQFFITSLTAKREKIKGASLLTLFLKSISKPVTVAAFALGLYLCKLSLVFENPDAVPPTAGISQTIESAWINIAKAVLAIAVAYAIYRLVDIIEFYLLKWTSKTQTKLDDMLVPVVRKALRVTIAIIAVIFIVDNVLKMDVTSILMSAGVGGIAIALAARDTVANFFGSITIFADKPFQIDDILKIDDHWANVEEVGFRSTKVKTFYGHQLTIPNSLMANQTIENISKRPFIRRISNITITYGSGHTKARRAVEIIKDILKDIPEVNTDPDLLPKVYFNDFNDWSLNIYMSYWVKPPDYWLFFEVSQRVNLEMMKRFEAEAIEFAFPTQTLYMKKEQ